jgi:hypothetical protein
MLQFGCKLARDPDQTHTTSYIFVTELNFLKLPKLVLLSQDK